MSLYFKSLAWVIPQVMLSAPANTDLAVISPWLSNVDFPAPFTATQQISLSALLDRVVQNKVRPILVIRDNDYRFQGVINKLSKVTVKKCTIITVEHIHTKAIVTQRLALTTSGNLLPTSLYRNRESATLQANAYQSARRWLALEQDLQI